MRMKKGNKTIISTLIGAVAGAVAGGLTVKTSTTKKIEGQQETLKKVHELYCAFDQWLHIHQEGKTLVEYFKNNNYKTVAIYGMKELGERLVDELRDSDIKVCYAIDKNANQIYSDIDIVTPDDELEPVDVIVVTAIYYFYEIEEMLNEKVDYPVVSLEDILYGM